MLNELIRYAEKNGIPDIPGFKTKSGKWLIELNNAGQLIDVVKDEKRYSMCPHLEQFELVGGVTKSHFLMDTLGVVAKYESKEKDTIKHKYYINLLKEASSYEPCLKACISFLSDESAIDELHKKLNELKAKGIDNATFSIAGISVVDTVGWHHWWMEYRKTINGDKEKHSPMICLADGELSEPIPNHFKVSGMHIVGGQSSGTTLISFDKEAFTSFNLSQSLNAPCSEKVAAAYRNALDDLIEKAPQPICDSLFLHWYKEPIPNHDDPFAYIDFKDSEDTVNTSAVGKANKLLNAVRQGTRPDLINNKYYILQMSGAGGRIMVRDWLTGDYGKLLENITAWFEDLSIIEPHGYSTADDFKLSAVLLRLISFRPRENSRDSFERVKKELTPIEPIIWRSIIENKPLPDSVASRALRYISSKLLTGEVSLDENLDRIGCALLKAYVIRLQKLKGGKNIMKPEYNENIESPAYYAGSMLAVLAAIQQEALGDVNAGLVQRYYSAASTTPKLVIGRLVLMSQYHLNKLSKDNKGLALIYEKQLAEILSKIEVKSVPILLNLEGQTYFALGYYQQKAQLLKDILTGKSSVNN